jgi:hypothetical protein
MANEKILDALMSIFDSAHYRPLTLRKITDLMRQKGFYTDIPYSRAVSKINNHLGLDRNSAYYPFLEMEIGSGTLWALETWFPKPRRSLATIEPGTVEPLPRGAKTQHKISDAQELEEGFLLLDLQWFRQLRASMSEAEIERALMPVQCYASTRLFLSVNRTLHRLQGKALQDWYVENGIGPGDVIWLELEEVKPLTLRIYTEWDRDADTYRRYVQKREIDKLPRVALPIRDLIWLYFKRTDQIAHWSEIAQAVLEDRPEISEHSISACLSVNPLLFAPTGERGNWGLEEWGVGEKIVIHPQVSADIVLKRNVSVDTAIPLDYILETIHGEDLVFQILKSAKTPLSYSDLASRISEFLGVDHSILKRTTFLNVEDSRIVHLHSGDFELREDLESVVDEMSAKVKALSLERSASYVDIDALREEMAAVVSEYEGKLQSAKAESVNLTNQCANLANQMDSLRHENQSRISELEDRLAESTKKIDETLARLAQTEEERNKAQQSELRIRAESAESGQGFEKQIAELQSERAKILSEMQAEVRQLEYERDEARSFARDFFAQWPRPEVGSTQIESERNKARRFALRWFAMHVRQTEEKSV